MGEEAVERTMPVRPHAEDPRYVVGRLFRYRYGTELGLAKRTRVVMLAEEAYSMMEVRGTIDPLEFAQEKGVDILTADLAFRLLARQGKIVEVVDSPKERKMRGG